MPPNFAPNLPSDTSPKTRTSVYNNRSDHTQPPFLHVWSLSPLILKNRVVPPQSLCEHSSLPSQHKRKKKTCSSEYASPRTKSLETCAAGVHLTAHEVSTNRTENYTLLRYLRLSESKTSNPERVRTPRHQNEACAQSQDAPVGNVRKRRKTQHENSMHQAGPSALSLRAHCSSFVSSGLALAF